MKQQQQRRSVSAVSKIEDLDYDDNNNYTSSSNSPDFFNINNALEYTCARLNGSRAAYCGRCDTCQIQTQLGNCKQWFARASHLKMKTFVLDLVKSIREASIYAYLNNLLKVSIDSKDFIYSRNKMIPSIRDDHLIVSAQSSAANIGGRNTPAVASTDEVTDSVLRWYTNANHYIKLNFMTSLLKECEQSIIYMAILQIKTILEAPRSLSAFMSEHPSDANYFSADSAITTTEQARSTKLTSAMDTFRSSGKTSVTPQHRVTITVNSDYDDEIINDTDDESFNGEFDLSALCSNLRVLRKARYVDFIRQLPVHLSKRILSNLDKKSQFQCLLVSKFWYNLVKETRKNANLSQMLLDDMMLLRGTTSKICNPKYANDIDVKVPNLKPGSFSVLLIENEEQVAQKNKADFNWANAYKGVNTRLVIMEERNVFCGSYNVLLLKDKRDSHRVVSLNGKTKVALGSFDKKIRFIDIKTANDTPMTIQGHAGSIKCIHISELRGYVFTGSYDTSIRCWSLTTGRCLRIFQGHQSTVTCISFCDDNEQLVTGSYDRTCRVWSMRSKINQRVFKHKYAISAVALAFEDMCISGGYKGKVKVFQITTGLLIKTISVHTGLVTGIKFDKWHIVTCSTDGYALAFSAQGSHKKCLMAMRHPKAVLCLEYQYLRAITGSADGKIRIWNILNGDCLRVMRGNSQCDPVLSMQISFNRILINTEFNVILMEFEPVVYDYSSKRELESENLMLSSRSPSGLDTSRQKRPPYPHIRATRMECVGTPNPKLFNDDRKSVMSHSSGPVSAKTLNEAKMIQQPRSNLSTSSKLSIVTLNTPMSFNTLTSTATPGYSKSILSYVNVQSEINLNSGKRITDAAANEVGLKLDMQTIDQEEASLLRYKKLTLDETKLILRNQLRNMRKTTSSSALQQHRTKFNITPTSTNSSNVQKNVDTSDKKAETKSCIETALINRNQNFFDVEHKKPNSSLKRPTSSPGFYDTKTKLKISADEFQQFLTIKPAKEGKLETPRRSPEESRVKPPPILKTAITKVFEAQELSLRTNSSMYPPNVNTKIPNPKLVVAKRASSSFDIRADEPQQQQQHVTINLENGDNNVKRPQTAMEIRRPPLNRQLPARQRTVKFKQQEVIENFETNKLLSGDNLKLMTHKEVDDIVNQINILYDMSQLKKKKEDEQTYKKLWLLKSTGAYHGSLLAKQKPYAPEIRE